MTQTEWTATDTRHMNRIYDIYDPWLAATHERESWTITLPSGRQYRIYAPLGAAIEIEAAGFRIVATAS